MWEQFHDNMFENILNRERYKIIMKNAKVFSGIDQHFEDMAELFKTLTIFGLKI